MKRILLVFLWSVFSFSLYAQKEVKIEDEIDDTAFLLGMLDYSVIRLEDSKYEDYLHSFSEKDKFLKNLFLETLEKIDIGKQKNIEIFKDGKYTVVKSKPMVDYLDSYLVFFPYSRKETLKKEFRDKDVLEAYINPYVFSPKQQMSFVLGFLISKAKINQRDRKLYVEGEYVLTIKDSKMFFEVVYSFMESVGIAPKSSEIRQHSYKYGYEVFFGRITVNLPDIYKEYVSEKIKLRDKNNK